MQRNTDMTALLGFQRNLNCRLGLGVRVVLDLFGCHFPFSFFRTKRNFSKERVGFIGGSQEINICMYVPNVLSYVCIRVCMYDMFVMILEKGLVLNASKESS